MVSSLEKPHRGQVMTDWSCMGLSSIFCLYAYDAQGRLVLSNFSTDYLIEVVRTTTSLLPSAYRYASASPWRMLGRIFADLFLVYLLDRLFMSRYRNFD